MKKFALSLIVIAGLFTSCDSDDDAAVNQVVAPPTYEFQRNGQTSISFSGQTTRIRMAEEIIDALKDPSFTEAQIDGMYTNTGDNFSDPALNAETSKVVRTKTAASFDFFGGSANLSNVADFDGWIAEQVTDVYPAWANAASAGNPGFIQEGVAQDGSTRYVNGKGLELNQAFNKSLIGALMVDQMLNNYISEGFLSSTTEAHDNDILVEGKNYTDMEHDWDEAYGYLFGTASSVPTPLVDIGEGLGGSDSFLNKYLDRVNDDPDFNGIAQDIYDALKLGRAAIVEKNYEVRNEQAEIIREKVSQVIGVRAVYYLQSAKNAFQNGDNGSGFHDLSEGYGFIYSLQFTREPNSNSAYFSKNEVDTFLADLLEGNGFWDIANDTTILDTISDAIATRFGSFTVAQAAP
ncbi:MAG: DUF4856 domain-containing protein [Winogradskyella sp.]|uniref:DUF4856 domain-containing protein n=1 Tax=Winogradskyella sp. TaxID=1883156 RepID=UPI000F4037F5|nr:DUF4856 domain-containing protein [Winogradskyella sp.]RNC80236.1 MAG: DUF4856 domain-containing protein [Winogradskyella sp.]